jgi:predicted nucleic acid-binding Zn ribbon protein
VYSGQLKGITPLRVCKRCGKPFKPRTAQHKYCSTGCAYAQADRDNKARRRRARGRANQA